MPDPPLAPPRSFLRQEGGNSPCLLWISKLRIILLLAVLGIPAWGLAAPAWVDTVVTDGRRIGCMTERLVTAPFRASSKEWKKVGLITGVVGLSALLDKQIQGNVIDDPPSYVTDDIGHFVQENAVFFGTATAIYVVGHAIKKQAIRRIGPELITAFAVAATGTQLVKFSTGRARPDQGDGPGHFVGPTIDDQFHSFWSGDVTKAFVLASVLSAEAKHPVVTIMLYGLASATVFQRLHADRHWFSDVVSAAVWSTAVGIGTVKIGNRK